MNTQSLLQSLSSRSEVTGVSLPLGSTPLASASITGLVQPGTPVTVTSVPSGQSIMVTPSNSSPVVTLSPRNRMSPRRTVALSQPSQVTLPPLPGQSEGKTVTGLVSVQPVQPVNQSSNNMSPLSLEASMLATGAAGVPLASSVRQLSPRAVVVQSTPSSSPLGASMFQNALSQSTPAGSPIVISTVSANDRQLSPRAIVAAATTPMMTGEFRPMTDRSPQQQLSPRRSLAMRQMSPRAALTPAGASLLGSGVMRSPTYQGLMAKADKTNELTKYGYMPIQTLMSKDSNGNPQAEYIKAIDKMGRTIFVYLDQTGYSAVSQSDLTHIDAKSGVLIPLDLSDKKTAMDKLGNDASGVAFECSSGVCLVTRNGHDEPREVTFTNVKQHVDQAIVVGDYPISFPVFRLSEIVANPELVLKNTAIATTNIRQAAFASANAMLSQESVDIKRLSESFNKFVETRNAVITKLKNDISSLEDYNARYAAIKSAAPIEALKHETVLKELQVRHKMVPEILRSSRAVADYRNQIEAIISSVDQVTRDMLIKLGTIQGISS